jgi:hypothetical protein
MRRLTEQQGEELCLTATISTGRREGFVRAVERCVAVYQRLRERKSAPAVGAELAQIEKCIWRAMRLVNRRTWRPGEFHTILEDISTRLRNLSPAAREYLKFRNLTVQQDVILSAWPELVDSNTLIDPICFTNPDDQVLALRDLLGAFAGPVPREGKPGRRHKALERVLYHCLAAAYAGATGRATSDSATKFMAACFEIKRLYQLDGWNPPSLARSARRPRTRER